MAGNFFAKAIGIAALGIAAHDTVSTTNSLAPKYAKQLRVKQLNDVYMRTSSLSEPSIVGSKMQNWSKRWALDNNIYEYKNTLFSNVVCFCKKAADNAILFGLGSLALLTGKGKLSVLKVPYLNKIAAGLLLLKGCHFVAKNALGIGDDD